MNVLRNLTIVVEHSGKRIPVQEVDDQVTAQELLNALAQKIDLPDGLPGVLTRLKTHKQILPSQSLKSAGVQDEEVLVADFERAVGGDIVRKKDNTPSLSVIFGDEIVKNSSIFPNLSQEFIVTTADKVKISLIEYREALRAKNDWITPLGILLALIPSLVAADFKQFLGIEPDIWQAIFIVSSVICFFWLIRAIILSIKLRDRGEIDYVIHRLKQSAKRIEKAE